MISNIIYIIQIDLKYRKKIAIALSDSTKDRKNGNKDDRLSNNSRCLLKITIEISLSVTLPCQFICQNSYS